MARSFGIVDYKVREAEYFLKEIRRRGSELNFEGVQFCASAFATASRSITFAIQASLKREAGFGDWYDSVQDLLKEDPLARFFRDYRNLTNKVGDNVVGGGVGGPDGTLFFFFTPTPDLPEVPAQDVLSACETHFRTVLKIVYDCYIEFGPVIDGQQYFTEENFIRQNKTIEDAEDELGFPRGYTDIGDSNSHPYRWQVLRDQAEGCEIEQQFLEWLNLRVPRPPRLPEYEPPDSTSD